MGGIPCHLVTQTLAAHGNLRLLAYLIGTLSSIPYSAGSFCIDP
jgi:hypothetical protein